MILYHFHAKNSKKNFGRSNFWRMFHSIYSIVTSWLSSQLLLSMLSWLPLTPPMIYTLLYISLERYNHKSKVAKKFKIKVSLGKVSKSKWGGGGSGGIITHMFSASHQINIWKITCLCIYFLKAPFS